MHGSKYDRVYGSHHKERLKIFSVVVLGRFKLKGFLRCQLLEILNFLAKILYIKATQQIVAVRLYL